MRRSCRLQTLGRVVSRRAKVTPNTAGSGSEKRRWRELGHNQIAWRLPEEKMFTRDARRPDGYWPNTIYADSRAQQQGILAPGTDRLS